MHILKNLSDIRIRIHDFHRVTPHTHMLVDQSIGSLARTEQPSQHATRTLIATSRAKPQAYKLIH